MKREPFIRPPLTRRKGPDYELYEALKAAARNQATDSVDYDCLSPTSAAYDPTFPQLVKLGTTKSKNPPVGWIEAEVDAYINQLIERSRQPAEATQPSWRDKLRTIAVVRRTRKCA